jgi:hypothetical protein
MPDDMVKKGGVFLPMFQKEAMWLNFSSLQPFAIKIYVGGVNAISGVPINESPEKALARLKVKDGKVKQGKCFISISISLPKRCGAALLVTGRSYHLECNQYCKADSGLSQIMWFCLNSLGSMVSPPKMEKLDNLLRCPREVVTALNYKSLEKRRLEDFNLKSRL